MDHVGKFHDCKHAEADLGLSGCSIGGAPGVGAYNGPATNVTTLKTDFPSRGLNGTAVNVRSCKQPSSLWHLTLHIICRVLHRISPLSFEIEEV